MNTQTNRWIRKSPRVSEIRKGAPRQVPAYIPVKKINPPK